MKAITEEKRLEELKLARDAVVRLRERKAKKESGKEQKPMDLFYMRADFGDVCEARGFYVAVVETADIDPLLKLPADKQLRLEWQEIAALHSEACELTAKILGL